MVTTISLSDWDRDKCLDWLETWSTTLMPSTYTDSLSSLKLQIIQHHVEAHNLIDSLHPRRSARIYTAHNTKGTTNETQIPQPTHTP